MLVLRSITPIGLFLGVVVTATAVSAAPSRVLINGLVPNDADRPGVRNSFYSDTAGPAASDSVAITIDGATSRAAARANLATGEVGVLATCDTPGFCGATANAFWEETLTFNIPGFGAGDIRTLDVEFTVDGTLDRRGQPNVNFDAASRSRTGDSLSFQGGWRYPTLTEGVFISTDAADFTEFGSSGDWSEKGPSNFRGTIDIFGDDPTLDLKLALSATSSALFNNTATFAFSGLPEDVTYTSESGVFLSQAPGDSVPVPAPATLPLLLSSLGMVGCLAALRRKRKA